MALTFVNGFLGVLEEKDYPEVYDAVLKIMDEVGLVMLNEKARSILKKHGARIEGDRVHFPKALVEKGLATAPASFDWAARNPKKSVRVGGGSQLAVPALGPIFAEDMDNGRRMGNIEDFTIIQKLYQASGEIDAVGSNALEPDDLDPHTRHFEMMYRTLKHTDKPVTSFLTITADGVGQLMDMIALSFGDGKIMEKHTVTYTSICPLSPLAWDEKALDVMMLCAERNQGISFAAASMGGLTSPVSVMGTAIQITAEILAGIVFTQLVKPGTPCIYGTSSGIGNLRQAKFNCGSPLEKLVSLATVQMARDIFHLPNRTMSGLTEAQEVDWLCGMETMQNTMVSVFSGCDLLYESVGLKDAIMTVSFEKMVLDMEIISRARLFWQGVDASREAYALDSIAKIGPQGNYLVTPETIAACRKLWHPSVSNWDSFEEWQAKGRESMLERANGKYKKMLESEPDSYIDEALDKELKRYIASKTK